MRINYVLLSDLINNNFDIMKISSDIINVTIDTKGDYPDYENWFRYKHIPGVINGERDTILAIYSKKIIGVCNIKKKDEKKICTLYIDYKFRRKRLGIDLVKKAISLLETDKPLITMPENSLSNYKRIIKYFNWKVTNVIDNCYKDGINEFIFNGEFEDKLDDDYVLQNGIWVKKKGLKRIIRFANDIGKKIDILFKSFKFFFKALLHE